MMSESHHQTVTFCRYLLWLLLLSGSVFVLRKPTDAQLTTEKPRNWKQWSGISSLFRGIFTTVQDQTEELILADKTIESDDSNVSDDGIENLKEETHTAKQESLNFERNKKVKDSFGEVVSEEVPTDTYSGKNHLSITLQQKKTQALEQQRQGIECVSCVDDGEGNVLPSSLLQAIHMQKRKAHVDQLSNRVRERSDGTTTSTKKVPTSVRQTSETEKVFPPSATLRP
jgi:hypothetical protein